MLIAPVVVAAALLFGTIVHRVLFWALDRTSRGREQGLRRSLVRRARAPLAFILPLVAVLIALPGARIPTGYERPVEHLATILTYIALGWGLSAMVGVLADATVGRYNLADPDDLRAREVETRVFLVGRAANVLIWILAIAAALMTFPNIRTLGTTLLASAGLVGLIGGLAARPVFENLVAGLQIAFTQPIRLDDVVVVQGECGRIEEIRDTFVVVRLWDERRCIYPLTWFVQNPFENWTRGRSGLVGTVLAYAPYGFDVESLRKELPKILEESPLWDGNEQSLQVVDVTEGKIQLRATMSARNSTDLWNLRCFVRERMVGFITAKSST
jgi:small-conductance mechanosensitive channel